VDQIRVCGNLRFTKGLLSCAAVDGDFVRATHDDVNARIFSHDQPANSKRSSVCLNQYFDSAEVMSGFSRVIGAELTERMKAFKKRFENHRHILALSFVSHKFSAAKFDRGPTVLQHS
jgi:hypothetical protein